MIDVHKLKEEQLKLSEKIVLQDSFKQFDTLAGIDQSYSKNDVISSIVVCDAKTMEVIEKQTAVVPASFPYIPGFLAYRELPAMIEAFSKLKTQPNIIFVDGQGILHPRRCGLASHFGLVISRPTIGIAQSILIGNIEHGKVYVEKELRGFEMKTREHAKPIYISPGHFISCGTALKIVRESVRYPHKLPEPLHLAHREARREMNGK
ncbi:MAG TPA: endonuclease V [Candidatus Nanoarchaeia archaeon]|nr:endonuclease V [Candidatus Nanoarchaeia archaeon]